jgi:hypothetical protein
VSDDNRPSYASMDPQRPTLEETELMAMVGDPNFARDSFDPDLEASQAAFDSLVAARKKFSATVQEIKKTYQPAAQGERIKAAAKEFERAQLAAKQTAMKLSERQRAVADAVTVKPTQPTTGAQAAQAAEVRRYLRDMDPVERQAVFIGAVDEQDEATLMAFLAAPGPIRRHLMQGFDPGMVEQQKRRYAEKKAPRSVSYLDKLTQASRALENIDRAVTKDLIPVLGDGYLDRLS